VTDLEWEEQLLDIKGDIQKLKNLAGRIEDKDTRIFAKAMVNFLDLNSQEVKITRETSVKRNAHSRGDTCDCQDWRDMSFNPFCYKCDGTGRVK
jgi:hypothetical protein